MRILFFMSIILLLTGCQLNTSQTLEATQALATAATFSETDAQALGLEAATQYDKENSIANANNAYTKRLAHITKNLKSEGGLALNFKVYLTDEINAFALPDGSIRVYSGLMDKMTDDELFFVIGHEIGHVKEKHSYNRMRMAYLASGVRKAAGASGGIAGTLSSSQLGDLAEAFIGAQYSQQQEYDADSAGLALMEKYSINTTSGVSALRKLDGGGSSSMLSSHPDAGKRAERIDSMR